MPYLLYSVIDTSIISPLVMKVKEGKCYVEKMQRCLAAGFACSREVSIFLPGLGRGDRTENVEHLSISSDEHALHPF